MEPPAPTPHNWFDTATGVSIGDSGGIYASGWAATRGGITETTPTPGTPILEKLTNNGGRVWSRRASVSMPTMFLPVSVATGGNGVVIAAGIKGKGAGWGQSPTTGWVARYSTAGSPGWQRAFGGGTDTAAEPTGVAISFTGLLWVIGTQRDATDHGTDVFVRTYAPHGNLVDKLRIDAAKRLLTSGGIDDRGTGAVATGWLGDQYRTHGGRVWRLASLASPERVADLRQQLDLGRTGFLLRLLHPVVRLDDRNNTKATITKLMTAAMNDADRTITPSPISIVTLLKSGFPKIAPMMPADDVVRERR